MATPQSTPDARVDEEVVEHLCLWRRALQDGDVSKAEAALLVKHFQMELMPPTTELTTSFQAIRSIVRCEHGVYGYRFMRYLKQIWKRQPSVAIPDNLIHFPTERVVTEASPA